MNAPSSQSHSDRFMAPLFSSNPKRILILGASGAIGFAFYEQVCVRYPNCEIMLLARNTDKLNTLINQQAIKQHQPQRPSPKVIQIDLASSDSIEQACSNIEPKQVFDCIFIASGWLHDQHALPEKTWKSLEADNLMKAYQVNAIGPILFLKTLFERINLKHPMVIGVVSARVGSISDNRMGGWHSYRASKAALHMLIKNLAIELKRKQNPVCIVGLQPGTTDSALSKPFQRHLPPEQLESPTFTGQKLLEVMRSLTLENSGTLMDFEGKTFEP